MSKIGKHTDGGYFVETWVGDNNNVVSHLVMTNNNKNFHFIQIEQGSTYVRNVKVVGELPQGIGPLAFNCKGSYEPKWEGIMNKLTNGSVDSVCCELSVVSNAPPYSGTRIHCAEIIYEDAWNPRTSWNRARKNLPIEYKIRII
jgi:hypothetical protein